MMRVVTTWDKEINSDFLGTFFGFLLQHKDADLISHYINNLRGDLKLNLSKNLVFCPNQVDPPLPVSWDTQN